MKTNEVMVQILSDNPLKIGFDTTGQPVLGLDSFSIMVGKEPQRFIYKNEAGQKSMLLIEGQRRFDLDNPIDAWNWRTLQVDYKVHPELQEQIKLIDPTKEADDELKQAKRLQTLLNILMDHEEDSEWVAKVYRRVLLRSASGLTTKVMLRALLEKAKESPDAFGKDKWVFEKEFFETEALLDLACERGVLIKDGDFYKKADGTTFANDRSKAIFELNTNPAFRHYVQQSVSVPVTDVAPESDWKIELDSDEGLVDLIKEVGQQEKTAQANPDGSVNDALENNTKQVELETLVEQLITSNIAYEDADSGAITVPDNNLEFASRAEFIGFLKAQPEQEKILRTFAEV